MMYGRGKSDSAVGDWPRSWWSKGQGPKGMWTSKPRAGHRIGKACHRRWDAYGNRKAKEEGTVTSLLHYVGTESLRQEFFELKRNVAPGVDGLTWQDYESDLERRIGDLHGRVLRGAQTPSRRLPREFPLLLRTTAGLAPWRVFSVAFRISDVEVDQAQACKPKRREFAWFHNQTRNCQ